MTFLKINRNSLLHYDTILVPAYHEEALLSMRHCINNGVEHFCGSKQIMDHFPSIASWMISGKVDTI